MIKKVKGGYAVAHCHGREIGEIIKKYRTKKMALALHRAIQANKKKKGK